MMMECGGNGYSRGREAGPFRWKVGRVLVIQLFRLGVNRTYEEK